MKMNSSFKVTTSINLALALVFAIALAGCGSKTSDPAGTTDAVDTEIDKPTPSPVAAAVSCTYHGGLVCSEFDANVLKPNEKQELEADCVGRAGIYSTTACSTTNHVGTCRLKVDGVPIKARFYQPMTIDQADKSCIDQGGTFQSNF